MEARLHSVLGDVPVDAGAAAVQDDQPHAEVIEQREIVGQAGEAFGVDDLVRDVDDDRFFAVCLDVRGGAAKPLHVVLRVAHVRRYPLHSGLLMYPTAAMDGSGIHDDRSSVNSHQLQQQELVSFLYQRFRFGFFITLFVALVGSTMAYVELEIQGREQWVLGWCALLAVVMALRWRVLRRFFALKDRSYFHYQYWHRCFYVGAVMTGLMLGGGAALLMPYITANVQIILHAGLLAMCAGAIAYLSTSFRIYIAYMVTMMGPVTIWLFLQEESVSIVLSSLYLFFMIAGWISVLSMRSLPINRDNLLPYLVAEGNRAAA